MSTNFFEALHQIATDKGIPRELIEQIVESAMLSAFKKQYGMIDNVRGVFDRDAIPALVLDQVPVALAVHDGY